MDASQRENLATPIDERLVAARSGLLDALDALGPLRRAVILVGAQAVYVHTQSGDADFAVSPFTFDADIALDPKLVGSEPKITDAMQAAGFSLTDQPGIYKRADGCQVDLLVPEAVGGAGRRGARLGVHGNRAAMKVRGLEGALIDHSPRTIRSLTPSDPRSWVVEVAGPAALLVSKIHKISERTGDATRSRSLDKDAFDIYRLIRAVDAQELATQVRRLLEDDTSGEVTAQALSSFRKLFGDARAHGTEQVVSHIKGLEDPDFITASSVSLSQELLDLISNS